MTDQRPRALRLGARQLLPSRHCERRPEERVGRAVPVPVSLHARQLCVAQRFGLALTLGQALEEGRLS